MITNTKLIIVDFDGPINDLLSAKKKTIIALCDQFDITLSESALNNFINLIDHFYIHNHLDNYKNLIYQCLCHMKKNHQISCEINTINRFSDTFLSCLSKNLQPNKVVLSALTRTKQVFPEIKICVYTSQIDKYVVQFFQKNQIDMSLFTKIYGSNLFLELKPSIKNLKTICSEQKVATNQTMMIGDDPTLDLLPAHLLGMKTMLFNSVVYQHIKNDVDLLDSLVITKSK